MANRVFYRGDRVKHRSIPGVWRIHCIHAERGKFWIEPSDGVSADYAKPTRYGIVSVYRKDLVPMEGHGK